MAAVYIIKIGGNVIDNEPALQAFLQEIARLDVLKILIHGGGKIATRLGDQLGITSKYVNGRRITDTQTIDLVTMVYGGLVNKKIVTQLQAHHCNAIGLTGADANIIPAVKRPVKEIDYGFAGDIDPGKLHMENIRLLLDNKLMPVIAPLTHDEKGQMLNTNADTIASSIAIALSKYYDVRLIYCFEKKGVLEDINKPDSVIHLIDQKKYKTLLEQQALADGILPKLENAFAACEAGVKEVLIGDATDIKQNCSSAVAGTLIRL